MFALEMITLGHSPLIGDGFCEMIVYAKHILPRDYLALRAYPFWEDVFILGRSYLADFDIETRPSVYDCYFWWIIELLTPWVQSSQHTWFDLDTHFPLLHTIHPTFGTIIPASILSEPHIFWAHIFHHLTCSYPFSFVIRGGYRPVSGFLVEFSHAFGH